MRMMDLRFTILDLRPRSSDEVNLDLRINGVTNI